jgi:N,N'-diacetyllegionaminate synthase
MVRAAARAGADYIKFQTFEPKALVTSRAPKAAYQIRTTGRAEGQQAMLERLVLRREQFVALQKLCRAEGIGFLSTAFDSESLAFVEGLRPDFHKISSGDINNFPLLRQAARYRRPVILSTGMATMDEIGSAIKILDNSGTSKNLITVLHCTTEYPTPMSEVNLRAMISIRDKCAVKVGFSDHTQGIGVAIAAVAMGATVIEKHFTLDRQMDGPDHKASLETAELKSMVTAIRSVEIALGDGIKRPTPSETKNMPIVRKSIVASKAIQAGEEFRSDNLTTKRPGTGISPMRFDEVLGQKACRNFAEDELIEL